MQCTYSSYGFYSCFQEFTQYGPATITKPGTISLQPSFINFCIFFIAAFSFGASLHNYSDKSTPQINSK